MRQMTRVSLPYPTTWEIRARFGGRPVSQGTLFIQSVLNNNSLSGAVNFRGNFIPIQGVWNEAARQIAFHTQFASYVGTLLYQDEPLLNLRHYVLRGQVAMKPPSIRAGETGTWQAVIHLPLR
ncbi:hypothetical protein [Brevibacillus choshinensis]|nr:hypothetical protein [Brevibacillus choshinensis]